MKSLFLIALLGLVLTTGYGQVVNWCGTDSHNEEIFSENPGLREQMHAQLVRTADGAYSSYDREDGVCIIPVVVHVLHNNGDGNISYEQIQSGLDQLNEDFNRDNADAVDTRNTPEAPFEPVASNVGVRFELAKIDPDGNCTNGVERRFVGSKSYDASDQAKHYGTSGLNAWNRNFYFNIWVVNSIEPFGDGITLGYAEFPYGGGSSNYGVIIRNDYYGTIGTASGDRTLTHEVGHCLGLLHTFQGGCHAGSCSDNGDYCCDTPPVSEAHWSCSPTQNSCGEPAGDPYGFDAADQFENYMSYSPCQNMFSEDQKNIVLGNFVGIGFLANLVDPDNNLAAGVGLPEVLCKAEFNAPITTICQGSTVDFLDESYANVTGWSWSFAGGTPATSGMSNPVITYNTPGIYAVELEVTDGVATEATTKENYILVLPNPGIGLPYSEKFETLTELPDNAKFMVTDEDLEDTWELNESVGYSGTKSAFIPNRGNDNRSKDDLISGTIDLSGVDADDDMIFTFRYAYKRRHSGDDEWLRFYISKDCGETWALRKNIHGDDLGPDVQSSSYTPASLEEWRLVTITNINSDYYSASFRYKFQFENDNGNNIYLDDINMYPTSMVGLIEKDVKGNVLKLYPNPTANNLTLEYNAAITDQLSVSIISALGQEVANVFNGQVEAGKNVIQLNVNNLPAGIYFLRSVDTNGTVNTTRFVKK